MKTIISGGRNYELTRKDVDFIWTLPITEVVSGHCNSGADYWGEMWAGNNNIPLKLFPADWEKHGKAAGPIRNRQMAEYAEAVILFPGGRGTDSMYQEAKRAGLKIFDRRQGNI